MDKTLRNSLCSVQQELVKKKKKLVYVFIYIKLPLKMFGNWGVQVIKGKRGRKGRGSFTLNLYEKSYNKFFSDVYLFNHLSTKKKQS